MKDDRWRLSAQTFTTSELGLSGSSTKNLLGVRGVGPAGDAMFEGFRRHASVAARGSENPEFRQASAVTARRAVERVPLRNGSQPAEGIITGVWKSTGIRSFGQYSDVNHLNGILARIQFWNWKHGSDQSSLPTEFFGVRLSE